MDSPCKRWLFTGAILGGLAVAAGSFGVHGLKAHLAADGSLSDEDMHLSDLWRQGTRYQMYHALALLAVGLLAAHQPSRSLHVAGAAMTTGTVIFSGCLYALVLTGQRWLGAIVPIGGVLMIVGWIMLAASAVMDGSSAKGDSP